MRHDVQIIIEITQILSSACYSAGTASSTFWFSLNSHNNPLVVGTIWGGTFIMLILLIGNSKRLNNLPNLPNIYQKIVNIEK